MGVCGEDVRACLFVLPSLLNVLKRKSNRESKRKRTKGHRKDTTNPTRSEIEECHHRRKIPLRVAM